MARLFTALMVFGFFFFINIAAALFSPANATTNPLAPTVALFQWVADILFAVGLIFLTVKGLQKLIGRPLSSRTGTSRPQTSHYRYDRTPLNAQDAGWRMVDTRTSLPFDAPDSYFRGANGNPQTQTMRQHDTY